MSRHQMETAPLNMVTSCCVLRAVCGGIFRARGGCTGSLHVERRTSHGFSSVPYLLPRQLDEHILQGRLPQAELAEVGAAYTVHEGLQRLLVPEGKEQTLLLPRHRCHEGEGAEELFVPVGVPAELHLVEMGMG